MNKKDIKEEKAKQTQTKTSKNQRGLLMFLIFFIVAMLFGGGGYYLSVELNSSFGGSTKLDNEVRKIIIQSRDNIYEQQEIIDNIGPLTARIDTAINMLDNLANNPSSYVKFDNNHLDEIIKNNGRKKLSKSFLLRRKKNLSNDNYEDPLDTLIRNYFNQTRTNVDRKIGRVLIKSGFQCGEIYTEKNRKKEKTVI